MSFAVMSMRLRLVHSRSGEVTAGIYTPLDRVPHNPAIFIRILAVLCSHWTRDMCEQSPIRIHGQIERMRAFLREFNLSRFKSEPVTL